MIKITNEKTLCAVINPKDTGKRAWVYNCFLGNVSKTKKDHGQRKINWLMELDEREMEILMEKGCKIIKIETNNVVKETPFKDAYISLMKLFNELMTSEQTIKLKIRKSLTNGDGRPSKDYNTIINTKKKLSSEELKQIEVK